MHKSRLQGILAEREVESLPGQVNESYEHMEWAQWELSGESSSVFTHCASAEMS